jgi:hypothetical protein
VKIIRWLTVFVTPGNDLSSLEDVLGLVKLTLELGAAGKHAAHSKELLPCKWDEHEAFKELESESWWFADKGRIKCLSRVTCDD